MEKLLIEATDKNINLREALVGPGYEMGSVSSYMYSISRSIISADVVQEWIAMLYSLPNRESFAIYTRSFNGSEIFPNSSSSTHTRTRE